MLSQGFALDRTVDSSGTSQDVQWPRSRTCLLRNCAHDGSWTEADYDVFDDARHVGRIYLVGAPRGRENWFWGASFRVTKRNAMDTRRLLRRQKPRLQRSISPPSA